MAEIVKTIKNKLVRKKPKTIDEIHEEYFNSDEYVISSILFHCEALRESNLKAKANAK